LCRGGFISLSSLIAGSGIKPLLRIQEPDFGRPMKRGKTKRNQPAGQKNRAMRERPKMPPISEEMKQWSALLKAEVSGWPQVSSRPMFGMHGVYRRKRIFAALPATRAIGTPNSVAFRLNPVPRDLAERALKEPRVTAGMRWHTFEVHSTEDLRDALWWLNQAYERTK
jgi:hypothetical protein